MHVPNIDKVSIKKPLEISATQKLDFMKLYNKFDIFSPKMIQYEFTFEQQNFEHMPRLISQTRVLSAFETKQQLGLAFCVVSLVCGSF